jgi:hypothetical protein
MPHLYWAPSSSDITPVLDEVRLALTDEPLLERQYDNLLGVFQDTPLMSLIDAGEVTLIGGSAEDLHVWQMEFVDQRTGNMFFVVSQEAVIFLHFFIDAGSGSSAFVLHTMEAEDRAILFWTETRGQYVNNLID